MAIPSYYRIEYKIQDVQQVYYGTSNATSTYGTWHNYIVLRNVFDDDYQDRWMANPSRMLYTYKIEGTDYSTSHVKEINSLEILDERDIVDNDLGKVVHEYVLSFTMDYTDIASTASTAVKERQATVKSPIAITGYISIKRDNVFWERTYIDITGHKTPITMIFYSLESAWQ